MTEKEVQEKLLLTAKGIAKSSIINALNKENQTKAILIKTADEIITVYRDSLIRAANEIERLRGLIQQYNDGMITTSELYTYGMEDRTLT